MPVTREELYEAVWTVTAGEAARKYEVSGSFLARICEQLNVPRPPRGYWAKLKFGKASAKPPLPPARPGDALEWRRDGMPSPRVPPLPPTPPAAVSQRRRRVLVPERHPLLAGVQPLFEATRPASFSSDAAYLRPFKRKLPDIFVSLEQLPRALDLANDLYRSLEAHGHRVVLAQSDGHHYTRPFLAHDGKKHDRWERSLWSPSHPTLVFVGSVAIGLTVYEPSEDVEARWVDGKYVRLTELPVPASRRTRNAAADWTTKHEFPSRRLAIRAYSPYPGTSWARLWTETSVGRLGTSVASIREELVDAAAPIADLVAQAERERRETEARQAAEHHRWCTETAYRHLAEATKTSKEQILSIVEGWSLAIRMEEFFEDAARRAAVLTAEEKEAVARRITRARELLGGTDALQRLKAWKAPAEHLSPDELNLLTENP